MFWDAAEDSVIQCLLEYPARVEILTISRLLFVFEIRMENNPQGAWENKAPVA